MFPHIKMVTQLLINVVPHVSDLLIKMWGGWRNQGPFRQKAVWRHKGKKHAPKAGEECPRGRGIPQRGMVKKQQTSRDDGAGSGYLLPLPPHPQLSSPPLANPIRILEDTVSTTTHPRGGWQHIWGGGERNNHLIFLTPNKNMKTDFSLLTISGK